ncbi:hypothetical protein B0H11DRAFT_1718714, partial [Mycena galericulata]
GYDDEILRLCAQLSTLESDRAALQAYHIAYRIILAPIRRLPTEVVAGIFVLCADSFCPLRIADYQISRLGPRAPFILSEVCSRWHDMVAGKPLLWNIIELNRTV